MKTIWTKERIAYLLEKYDEMVNRSLLKLYSYQTREEQLEQGATETNFVGFNAFDAPTLSSLAMQLIDTGVLTEMQIRLVRFRIKKYIGQLTKAANGELY